MSGQIRFYAAVDLGYSRCGYGWCEKGTPQQIHYRTSWRGLPAPYQKTYASIAPILSDAPGSDGNLFLYGAEAVFQPAGVKCGKVHQQIFAKLFSAQGMEESMREAVTAYLAWMNQNLISDISGYTGLSEEEILQETQWILPAPLSAKKTQLGTLQTCAAGSGMGRTRFITEPIACALSAFREDNIPRGKILVVLDVGEWTAKAAAVKWRDPGLTLIGARQERIGSHDYDTSFFRCLERLFGIDQLIPIFRGGQRAGYQKLLESWIKSKETMQKGQEMLVAVGPLLNYIRKNHSVQYNAVMKKRGELFKGVVTRYMTVKQEMLKEIGEPVFRQIWELLEKLLSALGRRNSENIIFVFCGGFMSNWMLQEFIKDHLEKTRYRSSKILRASNRCRTAFIEGALSFGVNPAPCFSRRTSKRSYGIAAYSVDDSGKGRETFFEMIRKGQRLPYGYSESYNFIPRVNSPVIKVTICSSSRKSIDIGEGGELRPEVVLEINSPKTYIEERKITVKMTLKEDLEITVQDLTSGNKKNAMIPFEWTDNQDLIEQL